MRLLNLPLAILLPIGLLAACGDGGTPSDDERSATGEVLEGTISDSMLPLATVTSQPPLLAPEEQEGDGRTSRVGGGASGSATAAGESAQADAAPASEERPAEDAETLE